MVCRQCFVALLVLLVVGGTHGKDSRMKLCGRDLVRMVVSSCGNSRLRRSLPEVEPRHHDDSLDGTLTWQHREHQLTPVGTQEHGEEAEPVTRRSEEAEPVTRRSEEDANIAAETPGLPRSQAAEEEEDEEAVHPVAPHWYPVSARTRRGLKGPAQVCCEVGCSINELIQYC